MIKMAYTVEAVAGDVAAGVGARNDGYGLGWICTLTIGFQYFPSSPTLKKI